MKITLSKSQWEHIGKKAGWIKEAGIFSEISNLISAKPIEEVLTDKIFNSLLKLAEKIERGDRFTHFSDMIGNSLEKTVNQTTANKLKHKINEMVSDTLYEPDGHEKEYDNFNTLLDRHTILSAVKQVLAENSIGDQYEN